MSTHMTTFGDGAVNKKQSSLRHTQSELNEAEQKNKALPKPYVPITKAQLKYNFEQFGRQHGIRIAII